MSEDWLRSVSRSLDPARIDTSKPNVARVWNYLAGGRDNFEADRRAARQLLTVAPFLADAVRASRAFQQRTVGFLAADAGLRQFLHIGTGIPAAGYTHEVAQAVDQRCRVVYVENDPVAAAHARALLRSPSGGIAFLEADARDTETILARAADTIDLARPVGVLLIGVLHLIEDASAVVARLVRAVPAGSCLVLMQPAPDSRYEAIDRRWSQLSPVPAWLHDRGSIESWFAGLDLIDPGIVEVHRWRPAPGDPEYPQGIPLLGGVGRKR